MYQMRIEMNREKNKVLSVKEEWAFYSKRRKYKEKERVETNWESERERESR